MKTKLGMIVVGLMALGGAVGAAEKGHSCCPAPAPAAVAPISDTSVYQLEAGFMNDAGEEVTLAALRGRRVVLAMFFANCTYACPMLVSDMARLRAALPESVRAETQFVLVSFDTERDTPAALRAYRQRVGLDEQWTLLHGGEASVQELAMLLGVKYKREASGDYAHSNLLTLLNAEGEIVQRVEGLQQPVAAAARALTFAGK